MFVIIVNCQILQTSIQFLPVLCWDKIVCLFVLFGGGGGVGGAGGGAGGAGGAGAGGAGGVS